MDRWANIGMCFDSIICFVASLVGACSSRASSERGVGGYLGYRMAAEQAGFSEQYGQYVELHPLLIYLPCFDAHRPSTVVFANRPGPWASRSVFEGK